MLQNSGVLSNHEHDRLCALHAYHILDTPAESSFDNLVNLATQIFNMPIAFISLIDEKRQWFKSSIGLNDKEMPREASFCEHTIGGTDIMEVCDTLLDNRFSTYGIVTEEPFVRYYAGAPLIDEDGFALGTLCVADSKPNELSDLQKDILRNLAKEVMVHIKLKKKEQEIAANALRLEETKKLESDRMKLSFVASKINNAVVINDSNNLVTWVNAAFEKITGFTLEDVKGKRLSDLITGPKTDMELLDEVRRLTEKRQSFTIDMLAYRKDKREIWVSLYNTVVLDEEGNVDAEIEIIIDITDKKKAEEELMLLSLVASKTDTGVSIQDKEGRTTWVNKSLERMTGYTMKELRGHQMGNILSPNFYDQDLIEESRNKSLNSQSYSIEVLGEKKDGTPIWFSISNTPILNSRGMVERQIDLISDITQRKQVEKEMIEAKEQALKLSQAKQMFLSVMSHEIRTPLNAVIGMTHLLLDNDPKISQIDDLNILRFSGENLLHIINDILDFTKIETGKMELEIFPFSLKTLANDIIHSLQVNVKKNSNELRLIFDQNIPAQVSGDKNRLYQILMNFLGNAIKFTDKGLVQLRIQLIEENDSEAVIRFEVEDNGIGIPKDKQQYIFETFTQAKTDISRKYGGTGLGLAITKKLLDMFNSEITVESTEGKGTTFSFDMRFSRTHEQSLASALGPEMSVFIGKKILVVDDNEINILIAKRILSKWGLEIDAAINGYEAIDKIMTIHYDLVFMDIKMPGLDGFETAGIIRDISGLYYKEVPIIALTASTLKNDHYKFKECGMNGHVLKPFNPEEIKQLLSGFLSAETLESQY
ncbi:PAS domain S-box protein [Pedobacter sp. MC2016-15]|uniref:PAS domain S-box protein n=1 Tax=Pedobacter sp. MC2016-15 TaxID=2994473 RepID=UPI0022461D6C|nr:PAS domain S-box protein [Pedobacter sp. MC2016-15]MCX2481202.1 PAS domain S-box protein [Pedobacter sp. MC2016-15]